ncbi:Coiled-coil domain-containing protein r3hcc1l [Desmophyllum pertusum]|uniref:Coiled-coil domain-containing protein r3hcc1l n=1 Tax=Desmophyllum pertusum TaxID=174260 RepID=A0A9X0CLA2_9CNID|nr:Coiled-coil domain-containing protein r3hcc1l [Desmophyllum pertusum]
MPKVTLTSECENSVNSENNPTVTLDVVNATSSIDCENLESENSVSGLGNSMEIIDDKIQVMPEKIEDVSVSVVTMELDENVGELETEKQKTHASKKKKTKKDKSKDLKDDKIKSKEKGEKKRKKEKKSVKDKSDKEENLDSEVKIKEEKKSKTREQKHKRDLTSCDVDAGKELTANNKRTGGTCSKNNDNDSDDDDNWESNFDESGDCLNAEHLEELSRLTGIANPEVHKTQYDYYSFTPKDVELDDEEFGHIVEIYNFSPDLKTQDLMQALSSFRSKGFDINWVDDTHALAVFTNRHTAQDAIQLCSGPLMKLRPVSGGTEDSKKKASTCFEFLQPYKERPQTSKLLADRLVAGALGMRSKMTREERVKEREKIKDAKSRRQQEKIQKAQIWGD